jgi:hypothetical protein
MAYDRFRYEELIFDTVEDLVKIEQSQQPVRYYQRGSSIDRVPEPAFNYYDLDRAARLKLYDCFYYIYYKITDLDHVVDYEFNVNNLDITLAQWLSVRNQLSERLYYKIIENGLSETAIYVLDNHKLDSQLVLDFVHRSCSVQVLKWLIDHGATLSQEQIDCRRDIPGFEYIMTLGRSPTEKVLINRVDDPKVVAWLWNKGITTTNKDIAYNAMKYSNFDLIKILVEYGCFPERTSELNCEVDNIMDIMIWLEDHGVYASKLTAANAFLANNIELLTWLALRGILPDASNIMQYDFERRSLYDTTLDWLRKNNHLKLLDKEQIKKCMEYQNERKHTLLN